MKYTPIPRRVRTKRPSPLPGVLLMMIIFGMLVWAQADDQAANERDRATLRQLSRKAAGLGCETTPEHHATTNTTGEKP